MMMRIVLCTLLSCMVMTSSAQKSDSYRTATFAGGCFWCMEPPFDKLKGVISTTSGYSGGKEKNPTYEEVSSGKTGHAESIQILYDPSVITYERLLEVYWHNSDPLDGSGQFCDKGSQYRPIIFYADDTQKHQAEASKEALEKDQRFKGKIVTSIIPLTAFYAAEEYHQDFYHKDPTRYYSYRKGCGRDRRLEELWGDQAGH